MKSCCLILILRNNSNAFRSGAFRENTELNECRKVEHSGAFGPFSRNESGGAKWSVPFFYGTERIFLKVERGTQICAVCSEIRIPESGSICSGIEKIAMCTKGVQKVYISEKYERTK